MITASTAAAPIDIPAIAPPDKVGFAGCALIDGVDEVVDKDGELVVEIWLVDDDFVVDDVVICRLVLEVNRERSAFWKATVIGCAHIVIWPETAVKYVVVP